MNCFLATDHTSKACIQETFFWGDFPGIPGVKTPSFHFRVCSCTGHRSMSGKGSKIPYTSAWWRQKKKEKKKYFLWLTSLGMTIRGPSMLLQMALFCSFCGWVLFHCIYAPHLYPFLYWWLFRLLSCLGYCKQCCSEHWAACIFLNYGFLQVFAQEYNCWTVW